MSSTASGRVNMALATVILLAVASGFVGTLHWMGSAVALSDDTFLIAQATSSPAPDKAATDQVQPIDSPSKEKDKKEKPPIGICRQDWIRGWDTPTYNCSILLGPA